MAAALDVEAGQLVSLADVELELSGMLGLSDGTIVESSTPRSGESTRPVLTRCRDGSNGQIQSVCPSASPSRT